MKTFAIAALAASVSAVEMGTTNAGNMSIGYMIEGEKLAFDVNYVRTDDTNVEEAKEAKAAGTGIFVNIVMTNRSDMPHQTSGAVPVGFTWADGDYIVGGMAAYGFDSGVGAVGVGYGAQMADGEETIIASPAGWTLDGWEFGSDFARCNISRQMSSDPKMKVGDTIYMAAAIMSAMKAGDPDATLLFSDWKSVTLSADGESGASMLLATGAALASALLMW